VRAAKFGLFFPQVGMGFAEIKQRAQHADRLGYDSILFVDHMWSRGLPDLDQLEAWTLMSATAAVTERIRVGGLVLCNSYRNPALLAKMASSLDAVSGGRLILGLGAGWMEEEYRAYGYPFPRVSQRIEQLEEGIEVIKRLFTEERATFQGKYYAIEDAPNCPKPVQRPWPPILIGGGGERLLLPLVARHADIWNCPNNHSVELPRRLEVLREQCESAGRNPDDVEVSEQVVIVLGEDEADFQRKWESAKALLGAVFDLDKTAFRGTPEQVAEQLRKRMAQGVTFFTFLLSDFHAPESLQLFAEKVIPAVSV
jgi:F420-dependent oxidoreductase-like protein